jgi:hypothetical protein
MVARKKPAEMQLSKAETTLAASPGAHVGSQAGESEALRSTRSGPHARKTKKI